MMAPIMSALYTPLPLSQAGAPRLAMIYSVYVRRCVCKEGGCRQMRWKKGGGAVCVFVCVSVMQCVCVASGTQECQ